jgi:hypothetical protein
MEWINWNIDKNTTNNDAEKASTELSNYYTTLEKWIISAINNKADNLSNELTNKLTIAKKRHDLEHKIKSLKADLADAARVSKKASLVEWIEEQNIWIRNEINTLTKEYIKLWWNKKNLELNKLNPNDYINNIGYIDYYRAADEIQNAYNQ